MSDFWNQRFSQKGYVYGEYPNEYLKEKLALMNPGNILFPAEGEGRNAVYATLLGWKAEAFDQSTQGKNKAEQLAVKNNISIHYTIANAENVSFPKESFDAIALIYSHFPEEFRRIWHRRLTTFLKKKGTLILECFSKNQIDYQKDNLFAGGPRDVSMLYDLEDLKEDFTGFEFREAYETEVTLNEGASHQGKSAVVRIFATKS